MSDAVLGPAPAAAVEPTDLPDHLLAAAARLWAFHARTDPAEQVAAIVCVRATVPLRWPGILARVAAPPLAIDDYRQADRGLAPVVEEMVGDLERMLVYPGLGYQVAVDTPADVIAAYQALREAGYTRHCLAAPR